MKIFIDAFGDIALLCIRQLFEKKDFNARDFLVRTYSMSLNDNLIDYLKNKEINYLENELISCEDKNDQLKNSRNKYRNWFFGIITAIGFGFFVRFRFF